MRKPRAWAKIGIAKPRAHTERQRRVRGAREGNGGPRTERSSPSFIRMRYLTSLRHRSRASVRALASTLTEKTERKLSDSMSGIQQSARLSTVRCRVWNWRYATLCMAGFRNDTVRPGTTTRPRASIKEPSERVERAKTGLLRDNREMKPAQVLAALSFGFRVSLLGPGGRTRTGSKANYEMTLWRPPLRGAFPHRMRLNRRQAHRPLDGLRDLRNRTAHHEPVFGRNPASDHRRIVDAAGWISPAMRAWIEHRSQVPAVIEAGQRQLGVPALGFSAGG